MKKISVILLLSSCMLCTHLSFGKESFNAKISHVKPIDNWTVSSYGFLIFPTGPDMEDFMALIQTKTHAEAQTYLTSIGFSSLGATFYTEGYANETVTRDEAINYTLNTSRVIQVYDILIKPTGQGECVDVKWQFVLAMAAANLSSASYYNLARGIYDENTMNKYATNPPASDTLSLAQKMNQSNSGHADSEANPCPISLAERRPFWGWGGTVCTPCDQWGYTNCNNTYYVIWFSVHTTYCPHVRCGATCSPNAN